MSTVEILKEGDKYNNINLEIEQCRKEKFEQNPDYFDKLLLRDTFCLKNNVSIYLKGFWNIQKTYFFSVNLDICVNSSDESAVKCKSDEEITKYFDSAKFINIFY